MFFKYQTLCTQHTYLSTNDTGLFELNLKQNLYIKTQLYVPIIIPDSL